MSATSSSNYTRLFMDAGITNARDQQRYARLLDVACAQERLQRDDFVGVGERGTGGKPDLYVVHRDVIVLATETGMFTKTPAVSSVCEIEDIANLRGTREGFKGNDVTLTGTDTTGRVVLKIVWGLGGPAWVEGLIDRQQRWLFRLIGDAMDRVHEAPALPSVSGAPSKAAAFREWARGVVEASGAAVTAQRIDEHANMIAASIRMVALMPLARISDLRMLYPGGEMPEGTVLGTFDDVYERIVARVGDRGLVDGVIDQSLAAAWGEYVAGCRRTYA